ncbi:MAG: hypothetical protein VB912_09930, partial [Pirellulaceae bacterium]
MHHTTIRLLILFAFLAAIQKTDSLQAENHYVNNETGDDRRDGRSPDLTGLASGPYRTITKALRVANRGDHIILAKTKTPYRESVTL